MDIELRHLRDALAQARTLPELGTAAAALGLITTEQTTYGPLAYRYVALVFPQPVPAGPLCAAMGWARPYALSGDVEQRRWQLQLWAADLADPHRPRIHTRAPGLGVWSIAVWLAGRPAGALPEVAAGASPAYDLAAYPAAVAALDLRPRADSAP